MNHAHNDWAELLAEAGVVGVLLLASLFVWALKQAVKFPWSVGMSAALLHCLVDFPLQKQSIALLFFVLAGLVAAAQLGASGRYKPLRNPERL